jgi:hypothetical protein
MRNFSQQIFEERYGRPAVAEWHLQWHDDVLKLATPDPKTRKSEYPDILEMQGEGKGLICCPEDQCAGELARLTRNCVWIVGFPYVRTVVTR